MSAPGWLYTLSLACSSLVMVAMVLVASLGWRRWRLLDNGGRWIVRAVVVMTVFSAVMLVMVIRGPDTTTVEALEWLAGGLLLLAGFAEWQATSRGRRLVLAAAVAYAVFWFALELSTHRTGPFHPILGPVRAMVVVGAAGVTLISRVKTTYGRWTGELWFWSCAAFMLIFGTEVVLDPLLDSTNGVRQDLSIAAFAFHQAVTLVAYLMIARSLWQTKVPAVLA
ncbi:MAG: hypothetical protein ABI647_15890 [Gemmatimonadota bacterium]